MEIAFSPGLDIFHDSEFLQQQAGWLMIYYCQYLNYKKTEKSPDFLQIILLYHF